MRRTIIAGNWKMNKTCRETADFIAEFVPLVADRNDVEIVLCPPYTALSAAYSKLAGTAIGLGAQDVFWKEKGAYTGQISPGMLTELGVGYAIVGHSESRGRFGVPEPDFDEAILRHFGDTDESVNRKAKAAIGSGITPIICVGETIDERRAGKTNSIVAGQTEGALSGIEVEKVAALVLAYEPVWAIGTGEVCDAAEANRVCGVIRQSIAHQHGEGTAARVRIQYGGSVKPDNAADLLSRPDIDGALVGGASLKPADLAVIINAARRP